MDWNERISNFFMEYVKPTKDGYTPSGNLTFTTIRAAAKLLLDESVFISKEDMKMQALKDYRIILPDTVFD